MHMMGQAILYMGNTKCNQTHKISVMKEWMTTLVCGVKEALSEEAMCLNGKQNGKSNQQVKIRGESITGTFHS